MTHTVAALAVASDHGLWTRGERAEARTQASAGSASASARVSAGEGALGPRWYDWACLALPYEAADGWAHWLLVRRSISDPAEQAYYRVHAPQDIPPGAMVRAVGRRWGIEAAFADAKGLGRLAPPRHPGLAGARRARSSASRSAGLSRAVASRAARAARALSCAAIRFAIVITPGTPRCDAGHRRAACSMRI